MEVAGLEHLLRKRGFLNKGWLHRLEVHRASSRRTALCIRFANTAVRHADLCHR